MRARGEGWRRALLGLGIVAVALATVQAASAAISLPELSVAETDGITLELGAVGSTDEATVTVVNPSDVEAPLNVRLEAEDTLEQAVTVTANPTTATAHDATRVDLTFTLGQATDGGSGSVVIAAEGFAPAVVPVVVSTAGPVPIDALSVLVLAALAAIAFIGSRLWTLRGQYDADGMLGSVNWDFSKSWATNITTIGALLGTVTAAGLLPEEVRLLAASEVVGLSVFFGVLAVLSGFVYTVLSKPELIDGEPVSQGYVKPFLLAAWITIAAVVGEVVTLALLLIDAALQQSSLMIAIALLVLLAIAAYLVLRHAWSTLGWTLINLVKPRPVPGQRGIAEPGKNWSLL